MILIYSFYFNYLKKIDITLLIILIIMSSTITEVVGGRIRSDESMFICKYVHSNGRKRYDICFALANNNNLIFTWNDEVENELEFLIDKFKQNGSIITLTDNKYVLYGPRICSMTPIYIEIYSWETDPRTINILHQDVQSNYTNLSPRNVLETHLGFYPIR